MSIAHVLDNGLFQLLLSSKALIIFVVVIGIIYLIRESFRSNFPKVRDVPEVSGALPFIGHLHLLGGRSGKNDCTVFSEWSEQLKSPIIQCRLGDQRTIIVSDFSVLKDLWVGESNSIMDRPVQPGFVEKLGVDLTGCPMTDQIRKCRAAAMRALGKPNWHKYYHLLEPNCSKLVSDVLVRGQNGAAGIDTYYNLRQLVFDLTLSLTYGARFNEVDDEFTIRFIKAINDISAVRASTETYRHFVPLLRVIPESVSETVDAERRRAECTKILYQSYLDRVAAGEKVDCILAALGDDKLTEDEIHGICLSLLQAAPDTVASGVYQALAWLSHENGQQAQQRAYDAILEAYNGDRDLAWQMAFREDKVPLITSITKETLRQFTTTPYTIPRRTNKDIHYQGLFFPAGITMIMNAQEANHDVKHYGANAWEYDPERFLSNDSPLPHYAFGAGVRICPAVAISNRIMNAVMIRVILAFRFSLPNEGEGRLPSMHPIDFSDVYNQVVAHPKFYDAKYTARDEAWLTGILSVGESSFGSTN